MTTERLEKIELMLLHIVDTLTLSIEKISIYNSIIYDDVSGRCSLNSDASEDEKANAICLISHASRLNLVSSEIHSHLNRLDLACMLLEAIRCELTFGNVDPCCEELHGKLVGGDRNFV